MPLDWLHFHLISDSSGTFYQTGHIPLSLKTLQLSISTLFLHKPLWTQTLNLPPTLNVSCETFLWHRMLSNYPSESHNFPHHPFFPVNIVKAKVSLVFSYISIPLGISQIPLLLYILARPSKGRIPYIVWTHPDPIISLQHPIEPHVSAKMTQGVINDKKFLETVITAQVVDPECQWVFNTCPIMTRHGVATNFSMLSYIRDSIHLGDIFFGGSRIRRYQWVETIESFFGRCICVASLECEGPCEGM